MWLMSRNGQLEGEVQGLKKELTAIKAGVQEWSGMSLSSGEEGDKKGNMKLEERELDNEEKDWKAAAESVKMKVSLHGQYLNSILYSPEPYRGLQK